MPLSNRELSELVQMLCERFKAVNLSCCRNFVAAFDSFVDRIECLRNTRHRLKLCVSRQWFAAARVIADELSYSLRSMTLDLNRLQNAANELEKPVPRAAEVAEELRQAESEFGQIRYDRENRFVAVATEPIKLNGIYLGEFEIRLLLSSQNHSGGIEEAFHIVALDPHPAASDDSVTHPHVRGECLCSGEAGAAIRSALAQGRICDFFLLVKSVLGQYNSASPYVSLDHWEGGACHDCGYGFGDRASYTCPACENDFCDDCMSYCRCCDGSYCRECLSICPVCHESVCSNCLTICPDCRETICATCLEENQCPCQQEKEENEDEPADHATAPAAV